MMAAKKSQGSCGNVDTHQESAELSGLLVLLLRAGFLDGLGLSTYIP
jgi:hypothetical protein